MEDFFISIGLNYTLSKALPYLLMLILGILLAITVVKFVQKKWLRIVLIIVVFALPFTIYFSLKPIYQGDFNNTTSYYEISEKTNDISNNTLYVLSLPGCPWCKESIKDLRQLKKQNPSLEICYLVVSDDENHLKFYEETMPSDFELKLADQPAEIAKIAKGSYPAFAIKKEGKINVWSNNSFGAFAYDQIRATIK